MLAAIFEEPLPKRRFLVTFESVLVSNVLSMLLIVLRRACLWIKKTRLCRKKWFVDSTSRPQEQRGVKESWKLCLNLCSHKWLRPRWSLVANLIPLELTQLKKLFVVGLMKLQIPFWKTGKLLQSLKIYQFVSFGNRRGKE